MKIAIIGGGVIGGGWASRFLLNGHDVFVFDPDKEAEKKMFSMLSNAKRSLPSLYDYKLPKEGKLVFCSNLHKAVKDAEWIQESVPERLDIKISVFSEIQNKFVEAERRDNLKDSLKSIYDLKECNLYKDKIDFILNLLDAFFN